MKKYYILLLLLSASLNWTCEKEPFVLEEQDNGAIPTILKPITQNINHIDTSNILTVDPTFVVLRNNPELDTLKVGEVLFHYPMASDKLIGGILGKITSIEEGNNERIFHLEKTTLKESFSSYFHRSQISFGITRSACDLDTAGMSSLDNDQFLSIDESLPIPFPSSLVPTTIMGNFGISLNFIGSYEACIVTTHRWNEETMSKPTISRVEYKSVLTVELNSVSVKASASFKAPKPILNSADAVPFYRAITPTPIPGLGLGLGFRVFGSLKGDIEIQKAFKLIRSVNEPTIYTWEGEGDDIIKTAQEKEITWMISDTLKKDDVNLNFTASFGIGIEFIIAFPVLGNLGVAVAPEVTPVFSATLADVTDDVNRKLKMSFDVGLNLSLYSGVILPPEFAQLRLDNLLKAKIGDLQKSENVKLNYGFSLSFNVFKKEIALGTPCNEDDIVMIVNELGPVSESQLSNIKVQLRIDNNGPNTAINYSLKTLKGALVNFTENDIFQFGETYEIELKNQLTELQAIVTSVVASDCITQKTIEPISIDRICNTKVQDASGKEYCVEQIGNLSWMIENLDYEGPDGQLGTESIFGRHYTFLELNLGNICPEEYRVPTRSDFENLINSIGAESIFNDLIGQGWAYEPSESAKFRMDADGYSIKQSNSEDTKIYSDGTYNIGTLATLTESENNSFYMFQLYEDILDTGFTHATKQAHAVPCRCVKNI
jgi:uncharacterized protein (TIGR02145 family)